MKKIIFALLIGFCMASVSPGEDIKKTRKARLFVVSSYHREYLWSRDTTKGFCDAMLRFGYFDNQQQADEYVRVDAVETSRVIVKKMWMNAKRNSRKSDLEEMSLKIYGVAKAFGPDLIFLGDDDAAEYIGKKFLDSKIPVVFWGINNTPLKYGLVDDANRPGHNVTGVYQSGYYVESLQLLKAIVPRVKTIAVLSDATVTGRSNSKEIEYLDRTNTLPVKLVEVVLTNDFEIWKSKAQELQTRVDAFLIAQYSGLKDAAGKYVPPEEVAKWYADHISIPEAADIRSFVEQGMLCGADDSGYNQAFEAVEIAHDILSKGAHPATYPTHAPKRGALMVNTKRAKALGITLMPNMGIEEFIDGEVHK
jgi:ABC-type uncharacterized transport system substrate-binding protein